VLKADRKANRTYCSQGNKGVVRLRRTTRCPTYSIRSPAANYSVSHLFDTFAAGELPGVSHIRDAAFGLGIVKFA